MQFKLGFIFWYWLIIFIVVDIGKFSEITIATTDSKEVVQHIDEVADRFPKTKTKGGFQHLEDRE